MVIPKALLRIALVLGSFGHVQAEGKVFRWAVNQGNSLPYFDVQDHTNEQKVLGGTLWKFGRAFAAELKAQAVFVVMPQQRIEAALKKGELDGFCEIRPEWLSAPEHFLWSRQFINEKSLLITKGNLDLKVRDGPRDWRIGAILGYKYPDAEWLFANARNSREDSRTMEFLFDKFMAGRLDALLTDNYSFNYYKDQLHLPEGHKVHILSGHMSGCAFSKKSTFSDAEIRNAFNLVEKKGIWMKIVGQNQ